MRDGAILEGSERWAEPNLLGVDVGFSKTGKSTGVAWRVAGQIGGCRTGSEWSARSATLPVGVTFDLAALDAPLVPESPANLASRSCEAVFYRGAFAKRCRPGMSHFGHGLAFRHAGSIAAKQFSNVVSNEHGLKEAAVAEAAIVEAFPSLFMAVLIPDEVLLSLSGKRRGKSDRLYEACVAMSTFECLVTELAWPVSPTVACLSAERDHDVRAAYICLLTAGFAYAGTATIVGDHLGGWFWLPPMKLWAEWAKAALCETLLATRNKGHGHVALAAA